MSQSALWGIIPAAGMGTRIQPLAFSKELLPVGSQMDDGRERPRAVSEYLVHRMIRAGVSRINVVIAPGKSDILSYYGGEVAGAHVSYTVQPQPLGLCDALFRPLPLIPDDAVVTVGLPDTVWFPEDGLRVLPQHCLSFLLFPVEKPAFYDAVVTDADGRVQRIQVKHPAPDSNWIWGAFKLPARVYRNLHSLWSGRDRRDEYFGTLVNAYLEARGEAVGIQAGTSYVDVGTLNGYREAIRLLSRAPSGVEGERHG